LSSTPSPGDFDGEDAGIGEDGGAEDDSFLVSGEADVGFEAVVVFGQVD
jgi:hypothetical protein